jgi:hypothetical protein
MTIPEEIALMEALLDYTRRVRRSARPIDGPHPSTLICALDDLDGGASSILGLLVSGAYDHLSLEGESVYKKLHESMKGIGNV